MRVAAAGVLSQMPIAGRFDIVQALARFEGALEKYRQATANDEIRMDFIP